MIDHAYRHVPVTEIEPGDLAVIGDVTLVVASLTLRLEEVVVSGRPNHRANGRLRHETLLRSAQVKLLAGPRQLAAIEDTIIAVLPVKDTVVDVVDDCIEVTVGDDVWRIDRSSEVVDAVIVEDDGAPDVDAGVLGRMVEFQDAWEKDYGAAPPGMAWSVECEEDADGVAAPSHAVLVNAPGFPVTAAASGTD